MNMRPKLRNLSYLLVYFCFLGMICSGCQEPVEGCLDIEASNFDPTADRDCCCTYPSLMMNLTYRAGETNFSLNTPYEMNGGDTVIFRRAAFYVSDVKVFQGAFEAEPRDTFFVYSSLNNRLDSVEYIGNFALVNRSGFSVNLGSFREEGFFDKVQFRIGLNDALNGQPIDQLAGRSRLAIQADSMHTFSNDGFLFLKFVVYIPSLDREFELTLDGSAGPIIFEGPIEMESQIGFNKSFRLTINYLDWIEGIDFETDTEMEMSQKLLDNLPMAFSTL